MACDPRQFMDFDFSQVDAFEKLILLSEMEEEHFNDVKRQHEGKIVIPYIDLPLEGTFSETKTKTDQLKRMLKIDYTKAQATTMMSQTMTSIGARSYLDCVGGQQVRVELSEGAVYSKQVTVTLRWLSHRGEEGNVTQEPEVTGGHLTNDGQWERRLPHNGETFFSIERDDDQPLSFFVAYNHDVASVELPPPPKFSLRPETGLFPTPPDFFTEHSDNGNGFGPHTTTYEVVAPADTEFVRGSAVAANVRPLFDATFTVKEVDELRIMATAYANTGDRRHGAYVEGRVSARLLRRVPR